MPAARSHSKGQSSPLYIVVTASRAVEVSYSAIGKAAMVKLGLTIGRAARVYYNSRHISAIIVWFRFGSQAYQREYLSYRS